MLLDVVTTVVTPNDDHDLVALDDLKSDLNITGDTDDTYLGRMISRSSLAIEQYCRRVFVVERVQDVFDAPPRHPGWRRERRSEIIQTSRFPITNLVSVVEGTLTLVQDTDFRINLATGQLTRLFDGIAVEWCSPPVTIIYDAGFATIPLDLQGAVTSMVQALQFGRTRDPLLRSENILSGLYAYTLFDPGTVPAGTTEQVASTLDNYRQPVTA